MCGVSGRSHGAGPRPPGGSALLWLQTRHPPGPGGGDQGGGGAPGVLGPRAVRQQLRALVRQPGPGGNRLRYSRDTYVVRLSFLIISIVTITREQKQIILEDLSTLLFLFLITGLVITIFKS